MAASPQVVTQNPLYLNARSGVYTAQELRKAWDDNTGMAVGACDYDSFRVRQRVAGANMTVDVTAASVLNRAYVRGTVVTDQGLYRVDYSSASILNLDIAAADATNPRIDSVYLCVEDQQHTGSNNQATVRVVTGTATGGATLDNRTGAGSAPASMSSILLADILVPAASASVTTANIRDRRPIGIPGKNPWLGSTGTQVDIQSPNFSPLLSVQQQDHTASSANMQVAAAAFMPARQVVTRIRWKYVQAAATAATSQYVFFIADASGRVIGQTAATAYTGAVNTLQAPSIALTSPITLEGGWFYIGFGVATLTAGADIRYMGADPGGATSSWGALTPVPNVFLRSTTGGVTVPTTILAFTDTYSLAAFPSPVIFGCPQIGLQAT